MLIPALIQSPREPLLGTLLLLKVSCSHPQPQLDIEGRKMQNQAATKALLGRKLVHLPSVKGWAWLVVECLLALPARAEGFILSTPDTKGPLCLELVMFLQATSFRWKCLRVAWALVGLAGWI